MSKSSSKKQAPHTVSWPQYFFTVCCLTLLIILTGKILIDLSLRLSFEIRAPYQISDSSVYYAIGRGILNGLIPYQDLFDTKPPGIFLISALSLFLSGGTGAGAVFQTLVIAGFPVIFLVFAWHETRHLPSIQRLSFLLCSFVGGSLIALYTAERSGQFQVESFGAFFGSLYALFLALRREKSGIGYSVVLALFLLLSIGTKEPFFLSLLACSFLLCHTVRSWVRNFLFPFCIAAATGLLLLFLTGYAGPYFTIYLHEIFSHHILEYGPPPLRGLLIHRIFEDLNAFRYWFGWNILFLFCSFLWFHSRSCKTYGRAMLRIGLIIVGVYSIVLAVGMGGEFFNHHFVFAVPAYVALAFIFLRDVLRKNKGAIGSLLIFTVLLYLAIASLYVVRFDYEPALRRMESMSAPAKKVAIEIDTILDSCRLTRYLFLGRNRQQPFAYTRHSPIGPVFNQYESLYRPTQTFFREAHFTALHRANLIVFEALRVGDLKEATEKYIDTHFSKTPWPCVTTAPFTDRYTFYYRTGQLVPE